MHWRQAAGIAAGGAAGAGVRWAAVTAIATAGRMPWPLLALNVAGSLLLGVLLAEEWNHPRARLLLHDIGGIGFCGGLTTFSTFTVDVVELVRDDEVGVAVGYGLLSLVLSISAVLAGAALLRRVRAIELPLEEEP